MINIYADCSHKPSKSVATIFDTFGNEFLISPWYITDSSVTAEATASYLALQRAKSLVNIGIEEDITIHTDCFSIAAFMNETLQLLPRNFQLSTRKVISKIITEKNLIFEETGVKIHFTFTNRRMSPEMAAVDNISYRHLLGKSLESRNRMAFGEFKDRPYFYVNHF